MSDLVCQGRVGDAEVACLGSFQMMLILLIQGSQFENYWLNPLLFTKNSHTSQDSPKACIISKGRKEKRVCV